MCPWSSHTGGGLFAGFVTAAEAGSLLASQPRAQGAAQHVVLLQRQAAFWAARVV